MVPDPRLPCSPFVHFSDNNVLQLHKLFWGVLDSPLFHEQQVRIPDHRTLAIGKEYKFSFLELPDGITFPHGDRRILITSIYKTFLKLLVNDGTEWQAALQTPHPHTYSSHATIIKGQPGIGMWFNFNSF